MDKRSQAPNKLRIPDTAAAQAGRSPNTLRIPDVAAQAPLDRPRWPSSQSSSAPADGGEDTPDSGGTRGTFLKSKKNPFSRQGIVTRMAEHVPVVNNAVQRSHKWAGDEEALDRARAKNPLRKDGAIVDVAEHIPLVNNVLQGIHRACGNEEELERAKERNPLGHAGYITQAAEHIPGVADGIRCIHKFRGHTEDAERARAFSLRKLVSKHGAVTKLAELLPGTNLVAAVLLEMSGDHEEAKRAMNMLKQYKDAAGADGALAKLAELFPGTDVIAFGLQCNGGHYASALRTICKTRWVDIKSKSTVLIIATDQLKDWRALDVSSDLDLQPKAYSLAAGFLDICIHLLDFNRHGERRWQEISSRLYSEESMGARRSHAAVPSVRGTVQDAKIVKSNEAILGIVAYLEDQIPEYCGWGVDCANWAVHEWRAEGPVTRAVLSTLHVLFPRMPYDPPPSLSASAQLAQAIQKSVPEVTTRHEPMPLNPQTFRIPRRRGKRRLVERVLPETAAAVSCLSFTGCLGFSLHTGPLACLAGCVAGAAAAHRKVKENLIPWLNESNAGVWEWMAAPVTPLVRNPRGGAQQPFVNAGSAAAATGPVVSESWSSMRSTHSDGSEGSLDSRNRTGSDEVTRKPSTPQVATGGKDTRAKRTGGSAASSCGAAAAAGEDFCGLEALDASGIPMGVVFEWTPELVEKLGAGSTLREYFINEFCTLNRRVNWLSPACWILGLFERQLRRFLNDASDGQAVPIVIPIPLPAGMYDGIQTWLPEIRVMLILWFRFTDEKYLTQVKAALVDGMIDQIANVVKCQSLPPDLRDFDPRLSDFTEPIDLKFHVALRWTAATRLRLEFNDISAKLHLPK